MTNVKEILDTMEYGPAPEANSNVTQWLKAHEKGFGHFINGGSVSGSDGELLDVWNPANGTLLARVAQGSAADVDAAVRAARKAFTSWSKLSGDDRARHLYAIA